MTDIFALWFEAGWNTTGEGHNAEYWRPHRPYADAWADKVLEAREECWSSILAHGLSVAAALCRAGDIGGLLVPDDQYSAASRWSPGCGWSAP